MRMYGVTVDGALDGKSIASTKRAAMLQFINRDTTNLPADAEDRLVRDAFIQLVATSGKTVNLVRSDGIETFSASYVSDMQEADDES